MIRTLKLPAALAMRSLRHSDAETVRAFTRRCEEIFGLGCRVTVKRKPEFPRDAEKRPADAGITTKR